MSTVLDRIGFYHLCAVDIQVQRVNELFRCTAILRIRNETNMARTISVMSELIMMVFSVTKIFLLDISVRALHQSSITTRREA